MKQRGQIPSFQICLDFSQRNLDSSLLIFLTVMLGNKRWFRAKFDNGIGIQLNEEITAAIDIHIVFFAASIENLIPWIFQPPIRFLPYGVDALFFPKLIYRRETKYKVGLSTVCITNQTHRTKPILEIWFGVTLVQFVIRLKVKRKANRT